jgi:predicted MPP superfamily phosphohydrolase
VHVADPTSVRRPPRRHAWLRRAGFRAAELGAQALGGRALYRRRHLARGRLAVREEALSVPALAPELDGYLLAHLSDFHGGPFLGRGDLAGVLALLAERGPDVVVVTGDWVTHRWSDALPLLDDLAAYRAPHGTFAVFGNHDYRERAEGRIAEAGRERGIRFLRNEGVRLARGSAAVGLVGLEDPEEARALDLDAARAALAPGDVEIVLCHNPLAARAIARGRATRILAGHSHGAQVDWPGLRRLGPPHPGARVELGGSTLVVSRGLGVVGLPWRAGAPAEVVFARLVPARGEDA